MNITWTQLHNLPVETSSGDPVGRVCDAVCDVATLAITHLEVKHGSLTHRKKVLIHQSHIVSITKDKVVVKDGTITLEHERAKKDVPLTNVVLSSKTEQL